MLAFLSFIIVMSFTPGPNTIMAMVSGQKRGFRASINLNWGMLFGVIIIGTLAAFLADWLQKAPSFITVMKVVGSLYLAYLTYHVFISKPTQNDDEIGDFFTGLLLPLTNIKVYLIFYNRFDSLYFKRYVQQYYFSLVSNGFRRRSRNIRLDYFWSSD